MEQHRVHAVLASFPRSGRTWLAGMVSAAELRDLRRLASEPIRAFVNSMDADVIGEWRSAFGELPVPPLRLATHSLYDAEIHLAHIVLVVRKPADSLWSYFHYRSSHRGDFDGTLDEFLGLKSSGIAGLARWFNSWETVRDEATVVSYEALRSDPGENLRRALAGLDCQADTDPHLIADRWSFERRQRNEIDSKSPQDDPNGLFIRSGIVGEGEQNFSNAQLEHLEHELRRLLSDDATSWMQSLGYLST